MIEVILKYKDTYQISAIINELKNDGYKVHVDFDFEFSTSKFDWSTFLEVPSQTKFIFYNETLGTWFMLKYG